MVSGGTEMGEGKDGTGLVLVFLSFPPSKRGVFISYLVLFCLCSFLLSKSFKCELRTHFIRVVPHSGQSVFFWVFLGII